MNVECLLSNFLVIKYKKKFLDVNMNIVNYLVVLVLGFGLVEW